MTNDVRPAQQLVEVLACTARSDSVSSALVASSSTSTGRPVVDGAGDGDPLRLAAREAQAADSPIRVS